MSDKHRHKESILEGSESQTFQHEKLPLGTTPVNLKVELSFSQYCKVKYLQEVKKRQLNVFFVIPEVSGLTPAQIELTQNSF